MSDPTHLKPLEKASSENQNVAPFSAQKFNANQSNKENIDFNEVVQIIDIRKEAKKPLLLNQNNDQVDWKFNLITEDKSVNPLNGNRKRVWTDEIDQLGNKKKEFLKKFKVSCKELQGNDIMMKVSKNKLDLLKDYCNENDIESVMTKSHKSVCSKSVDNNRNKLASRERISKSNEKLF